VVFQGRVTELAPVVDPSSRTMEIKVGVDNTLSRLKAGMFAKVKIVTQEKTGVVKVPASALIQRFGEEYVFVAEADAEGFFARKRLVTQGIVIDGVMEVEKGLNAGDDVVVRGQSLLTDGARLNIVDRLAPLQ
jgi:RND family efflux transporter MFP subunit